MVTLVTGAAGFIGYHLSKSLCERGETVIGIDNVNDYYDPQLKYDRLAQLTKYENFQFQTLDISEGAMLLERFANSNVSKIAHLAAQAGVRYSIENPNAYVKSNLEGHLNVLELARHLRVKNMIYASSSSIYGGNTHIPFSEDQVTDDPISFYGATKKSNELMSHAYSRLYKIPLTGLRFFTVYGPWGRPDMAYFIFSDKLRAQEKIDVFNNGEMGRDFTYIDDIVEGIMSALERPASELNADVPHRVYNLGNDAPENLMDMIAYIEEFFGQDLKKTFLPMQKGDVERTWADITRARAELNYEPKVSLRDGLLSFVNWYKTYYLNA